jgi:4'-phosphopantetheinyl transferase
LHRAGCRHGTEYRSPRYPILLRHMLNVHRWPPADRLTGPRPGDVDVWIVAVPDVHHAGGTGDELSPEEKERARRLRFDADRRRFVETRLALRRILGGCLTVAPHEIELRASPSGKPHLDPASHGSALRFNVSHSAELALVALARNVEVGVDLELERPMPDLDALVERYFSPHERAAIAASPPAHRHAAFFAHWTLKEAYLKACGDGLGRRLDAFDVGLDDDRNPRLGCVRDRPGDERRWALAQLRPAPGYAAAVAAESCDLTPSRQP